MTQTLWDAAKAVLKGVYSNTIIPQEIRKALKRKPNSTSKAVRGAGGKPQSQQKE